MCLYLYVCFITFGNHRTFHSPICNIKKLIPHQQISQAADLISLLFDPKEFPPTYFWCVHFNLHLNRHLYANQYKTPHTADYPRISNPTKCSKRCEHIRFVSISPTITVIRADLPLQGTRSNTIANSSCLSLCWCVWGRAVCAI